MHQNEGEEKVMRKVLVIDDEMATLNMFRLFLGAYGYEVFIAESGQEGLEIIEKEKPPIVFTDIKMPKMDGLEVLKLIKEIDPNTEVIVMTGHGDIDLAVQALNLDATDFINKPIQRTALDSALKRAEDRLKSSRPKVNNVSLRAVEGIAIMDIEGNITSHSEQILINEYRKASSPDVTKILMHFDKSLSINGAGIAALIQILSESKKRNQVVAITGISENFKKIFEIVGITKFAKIFDNEKEAISSFTQS